ncbi:peptidoglycan-binding protein [Rhodovastum atsumiense]|uniref:Caspase family p20 domain-containing protein n=1 Tax=Rhodovastum atsumiense TaxID=504468 RepID=A0A5M6IWN9_9PROT|nr:peptidoglycan-binding protein [Rhodovastum atsumiense]KAA5612733.1 hypothetical protein F1189_08335 [Rhodovastum atsumiense]
MVPFAPAAAADRGIALLIGNDVYAGHPQHSGCRPAVQALRERLRQDGFTVMERLDAPAVALRAALDDFAAQRADGGTGAALIYVCGAAAAEGQRLFVLPADTDLQKPLRPETQGIIVQALLNALDGSGGTLVAELGLPPDDNAAAALAVLRRRLPSGLHMALWTGPGAGLGALGQGARPDAGWDAFARALPRPEHGEVLLLPPPAPPAPPAPPIATAPPAPEPAAPPATAAAPPLSPRDARVSRLQAALAREGSDPGPIDGILGPRTQAAIRDFQARIGDPPTGVPTPSQVSRLLNAPEATP